MIQQYYLFVICIPFVAYMFWSLKRLPSQIAISNVFVRAMVSYLLVGNMAVALPVFYLQPQYPFNWEHWLYMMTTWPLLLLGVLQL